MQRRRRRRRQRERQKSNRFRQARQQLSTCITLFCTFRCCRCTTKTWNGLSSRFVEDGNKRQLSFFFFWTLMQSFRIQLQKNFANIWIIKRVGISAIKFETCANSLFKWRFRSRSRRRCANCLMIQRERYTMWDLDFFQLTFVKI